MEILTDGADKRTVLTLLDGSVDEDEFCALLERDFNLIRTHGADECLGVFRERFTDLSAAIIDVDTAKAHDYALLRSLAAEDDFETIPVLVASVHELADDDLRCARWKPTARSYAPARARRMSSRSASTARKSSWS